MKIIIVEDEKSIRNGLVKMLPKLDPEYEVVGSAKDGLEGYQQILAEQPDLVIMDITMPNMDGLQALKKIKEINPNATVVMCSAMGQESMVIEAIKSGAKDFIVKPFKADRILKTVSSIVDA